MTLTVALVGLATTPAASASKIVPDTTADQFGADAGHCALREAVQAARLNAAFGGCPAGSDVDGIRLSAGVYRLTIPGFGGANAAGDLDLFGGGYALSIIHKGAGFAVIDGGGLDRVLDIANTFVSIRRVTIRNGSSQPGSNGGAIRTIGGLDMRDSTITSNSSGGSGGGISTESALTTLSNVTIAGNRAEDDGGGVYVGSGAAAEDLFTTVTGNVADADGVGGGDAGGISNNGDLGLQNSIVAGNVDRGGERPDCEGGPTSRGGNVLGNTAGCGFSPTGDDVATAAPKLGPLADNGGPTRTVALLRGSPALNRASRLCFTDQRGVPRPRGGRPCDAGAYERVKCGGVLVNRVGTSTKDKLAGTGSADGILGLNGNDTLKGLGGHDGLCGGKGNDKLLGGNGRDKLLGQAGGDTLNGGPKLDSCRGGAGRDRTRNC